MAKVYEARFLEANSSDSIFLRFGTADGPFLFAPKVFAFETSMMSIVVIQTLVWGNAMRARATTTITLQRERT
ncbi:hypothetical protein F441_21942 [Phytophthora nicotianae CJ01A1]|uniref:Uncharacterized protein n=2 Tax=Phytophthora nicotianae TaxID=4792 RepID=W2VSM4_PHYNI|nr:hypothetical protein L915_21455 [Phytophthora nicotianae]ETP00698.1 hypothetical protein F441_21942 [Phytophthora nicotianae CJ01A1]